MLGASAGMAYAMFTMHGKLKTEQESKQELQNQISELSDRLDETEKSLSVETYDRLRILREKRNQTEQLGFKKQNEIRRIESDYK